jgi:hypothetical protein
MRSISTCAAVASLFVAFAACGPKQDPSQQQPSTAPTGTAPYGYPQQPGAYPQQQPGAFPQQPGAYPQPTATYPQPATAPPGYAPAPGAPTAAPPATAGQLSVPGQASFIQCSNDVPCGLAHCNVQYGKCVFPCQANTDCIPPNTCGPLGLCLPAMPQAAPAH